MKMHSKLILALVPLSSSASILRASRTTGEDESTFIRRIMFGSTTTRAIAELRVCPSNISNNYQSLPGVTPCTTNADCADFFSGDGPTCCVHPQCICGVMDLGASTNVGCVDDSTPPATDDVIRTDDNLISSPPIDIGLPTPPSPTSTPVLPTLIPTFSPTSASTPGPAPSGPTTLNICPSSISDLYQSFDGVTPCTTNADCADFFSGDGPTCCVHPQCICGVMDLGASTNVGCVDDSTPPATDDVIRTDDDLISSPPIDIGLPNPPSPTSIPVLPTLIPTPQPTVSPAFTPAPTPLPTLFTPTASSKVCPTSVSKWFQELDDITPCETNTDCANYVDSAGTGGPSCCLHPICVCGFDPGSTDPELSCVDDVVPNDDVTRSDDVISPPIDIGGGPTPPLPPAQDPTPKPTLPPSPVNTCPSPQAPTYQAFPDVTPCTTNADCANFSSIDGPTCCVYPYCICGVQNLGASNLVQCVAT